MTRSPVILINRFVHGSLEVSPAVLLSWVMMHAAIAPPTKAATTPSPSNPSQANFVTQQAALDAVLIETRVATVAAPTTTAFPQFSQPLDQPLHLAQAITAAEDGTGTVVTQTDNTFDITGGTLAGENLFHSFEQFGLSADQIANILATPDIENVLGRINGGNPSVINGLLQLTGGDANLFLINPAGIIFGPEAQVLVPAAFTATTADAIQFDDEWFHAIGTNDYASLVGDPTGFAFTSAHPGSVIQAGDITSPGNQVTLLGGIVINTGTIETSRGTVTIAAIPGENLVRITQEGNLLSLDLPLQEQALLNAEAATLVASDLPALLSGGTVPENLGLVVTDNVVTLTSTDTAISTDTGTAIVSGTLDAADVTATGTGGSIDVVGDRVGLLNATLDVSGTNGGGQVRIGGEYQGQGDIPNADQTHVDSSTTIAADAIVRGEGGRVIVWADDITQFFGTITAQGGSTSGDGGFAEVSGKESLRYDGQVFLSAPAGATGQLLLDPGIVLIGANGDDDSLLTAGNPGDPIFIAENQGGTNSTFQISTGQLVTTLTTSDVTIAAAQRIDLTQALDASGTDNDLTLNAPDINLFNDLILGSGDLTLTAANSSTTIAQDIGIFGDVIETAGGNITFNGTVVIDSFSPAFGDAINITTGFGTAGDITLNGPLDAQTDFADSVLLQAGTGNVVMAGAVGANSPLGLLDIRANDASLQDFAGDNLRADVTTFNLQASGNLDLDRGDINASETLSISAGGDLTLASASFLELTSFAGNINLNAQGNLLLASNSNSLNVDAENLNLQAGGSVSLQDLTGLAVSENTTVSAQTTATVNNSEINSGAGLTLTGNDIVVTESQLTGQTLDLTAQNTVQISDGVNPTLLQSEHDLTIQGNASITINALNQPESAVISGHNLALVSNGAIVGNGRFLAEGDIDILNLANDPGMFVYTPVSSPGIISAEGNVSFGTYTGTALKIEATGSIRGDDITITGPNTTALPGTDPEIAVLADNSALILRAGVGSYQPVNNQLPNLANAQNQPNVTDASPDYTIGPNTFSFAGEADSPATITVGNIDTSAADGTVVLEAPGDIKTGAINAGNFNNHDDNGSVAITSGGAVTVANGTVPAPINTPGQSIHIRANDAILVGALDTNGFGTDSSVTLVSETGDIQIDAIDTGSGGIDITAAGTFRAIGSFTSNAFNAPSGMPFFENDPALVDFLVAQGYDRDAVLAGNVPLNPPTLELSLITRPNDNPPGALNAPITIRYGDATQAIVNESINILGLPSQILILGDSTQPFVIGPETVTFVPANTANNLDPLDSVNNPNGFDPSAPFLFELDSSTPYTYPSEEFPENTSGLVAGIAIGEGTNLDLYGSLQNQAFEGNPDPGGGGGNGGGTGGGGTGGGGTGGGGTGGGGPVSGGNGGGGTDGGGNGSGGDGGPVANNPDQVPTETQNLEDEASNDLCEDRPADIQTADTILMIEDSLIAGARSPDNSPASTDPCHYREPADVPTESEPDADPTLTPATP